MKKIMQRRKRLVVIIITIAMLFTNINLKQFAIKTAASGSYVTLYFIDNTAENWVKDDNAKIKAIDNTNGHDDYWMTQIDDKIWSVRVPESAYNITFNRYSEDKTTQWNSWSAGGHDGNNAYYADGSEYGHWADYQEQELYFHSGDVLYLDISGFTAWKNDNSTLYINFTDASKEENNGNDVTLSGADKAVYNPYKVVDKVADNVYKYVVTQENEGASQLRFWRGNESTLWNCSVVLSYEEYLQGLNCVKITGWNKDGGLSYYETEDVELSLDTSAMEFVESEDGDFYFVSDKMDSLSGKLTGITKVKEITYTISDANEEVLKNGNIQPEAEWKVENIGFMLGYNLVKFIVTTEDEKLEYKYIINNTNIDNMKNLGIATDVDTDNDKLPDFYENLVKLNPNNGDTDEDGLDDFTELFLKGVSPLSSDTNEDGISDANEDSDNDGLSNLEEKDLETSLSEEDTDNDGVSDYEEVSVYQTNPLVEDTDGDGVNDGLEIKIGSDPLKQEVTFKRRITANSFEGQCTIPTISVSGLSADQVETLEINRVTQGMLADENIPGLLDCGYEFSVSGEFEEAEIKFEFDEKLLEESDFYPAIYYFNEELQLLEEVPNQEISGNCVSATVTHFSKYVLLNKTESEKAWEYELLYLENEQLYSKLDIVFVIDSSGSMSWNDSGDIRIDVTENFIDRLTENDRGAIIDFDNSAKVLSGFTSDKETLKASAKKIDDNGGTSLSAGISKAISLFKQEDYSKKDTLKYIIMLTDGDGSYSTGYTSQAAKENITICTIGLGTSVSTSVLTAMAKGTNGNYYHAKDAQQLYPIFDAIADKSDYFKDTDEDGINDYYEKAMASGQLLMGTGVSLCGMDYTKADSDGDGLADGQEIKVCKSGDKVYVKLCSNPTVKDTDEDGFQDNVDSRRLIYDTEELLIHQTRDREGIKKKAELGDNTVAPDLTFNDYSYEELVALKPFPNYVAGITPEAMMWGEMIPLFYIGGINSSSDIQKTLLDMVDTFRYGNTLNKGKVVGEKDIYDASMYIKYKNSILTSEVLNDASTKSYIEEVKNYVIDKLAENNGELNILAYTAGSKNNLIDNYANKFSKSPYPIFTEETNLALAIAIHQFQGHNITVTNYVCDGKTFSGTLQFHFYDHFGLDETDEIIYPGFCDWFVLQHYDRFEGKYVPFITTVNTSVDFNGTIN